MENKKGVRLIIWMIILAGMLLIYPMNLIRKETECASGGAFAYGVTESLSSERESIQIFTAQYGYLQQFSMAFSLDDNSEKTGNMHICLRDETGTVLKEADIPVAELSDGCYYDIPVNIRLKKGKQYQVSIQIQNCVVNIPGLCYTTEKSQHTAGSIGLTVNGKRIDGQAVMRYIYEERISVSNILCLWFFVICIGFALTEYLDRIGDKWKNRVIAV